MSTRVLVAASLLLAAASLSPARADEFKCAYTSAADSLVGAVDIFGDLTQPGVYGITSGTLNFSGGTSTLSGIYQIVQNSAHPAQATSADGYFYYDNELSPTVNPMVNHNGLLFGDSNGHLVNVYSDRPSMYIHHDNLGYNKAIDSTVSLSAPALAVPEPLSLSLLAAGVLATGLLRPRRSRTTARS